MTDQNINKQIEQDPNLGRPEEAELDGLKKPNRAKEPAAHSGAYSSLKTPM